MDQPNALAVVLPFKMGYMRITSDIMDRLNPESRSQLMAKIRAKNTKPELLVRRYLHAQGLRFRLHLKNLPGSPDLVFRKFRAVLFVHGFFWHNCKKCKAGLIPKLNTEFWAAKLSRNLARDKAKSRQLRRAGWRVLTIRECEIRENRLARLTSAIRAADTHSP